MTVRRTDVERGNHWEKIAVNKFRVSLERKSRGNIFKFRVLTIFSTFSGSLLSIHRVSKRNYFLMIVESYTAHILFSTNSTNIGRKLRPLRCFGPRTLFVFGSK